MDKEGILRCRIGGGTGLGSSAQSGVCESVYHCDRVLIAALEKRMILSSDLKPGRK